MHTITLAAFLGVDSLREVVQAIVSGIITGAEYALLGVAFALVLGVTGRFHFAFAFVYTATAYLAAVLLGGGLPLPVALLLGLAAGILLGVAVEAFIYRPVADRAGDNALLGVFVAGLGLVIAGENLIRLVWGNDARNLGGFPDMTFSVGGVNATLLEVTLVVVSALVVVALAAVLDRTIFGQQIRAVRGNPDMARAVGVDVRRIFLVVFAIGSLVGGIAALFAGMRFTAAADMGAVPSFSAFVVAFVAGPRRSPLAVAAAGLVIGLVEKISTLWLSDNLSTLTVFGLLFVWLAVRVVRPATRQLSGALSRRTSPSRVTAI